MSGGTSAFAMPREPYLTREYLTFGARQSPQENLPGRARSRFYFWARNALYHALNSFEVPRNGRALVPAYICRAAVEPFAAYGLKLDFYGIRRDCRVDFEDLQSRIRHDTRVVLAVHYFGFAQEMEEFDRVRRAKELLLFEDCAHVLRGEYKGQPLGSFGDASVFSYRKHLPMFDGAELLLPKAEGLAPPRGMRWRSQFEFNAAKHIAGFWLESRGKAKARPRAMGMEQQRTPAGQAEPAPRPEDGTPAEKPARRMVDNNTATFEEDLLNEPITLASRWVLRHSDHGAIARARLENFLLLREELRKIAGVRVLFENAGPSACPWVCPIVIDGVVDAHLSLRKAGIPAVTWGGVRPQNLPPGEHEDAEFLFANCIFLPLHQNLTADDMRLIAKEVRDVASRPALTESAHGRQAAG